MASQPTQRDSRPVQVRVSTVPSMAYQPYIFLIRQGLVVLRGAVNLRQTIFRIFFSRVIVIRLAADKLKLVVISADW
jgi:hypothetical protein